MKYTLKKPDGSEVTLGRDQITIGYNTGEINAAWPVKLAGSSSWKRVGELLGVEPPGMKPELSTERADVSPALSAGTAATVMARYADAYLVAKATAAIGGAVKRIGIGFGVLILLVGLALGAQASGNVMILLGAAIGAAVVAIPLYVLGILVTANGQVLKATLDTAVHSSPFLQKEEMANVMSL